MTFNHISFSNKKWAAGKEEYLTAFMYKPESKNV